MINNSNDVVDTLTGVGGQDATLGNGAQDTIVDYSAGDSTITLGQGAADFGVDASSGGHDTITLGQGAADTGVDVSSGGHDTITLGNGAGDIANGQSNGGHDTIILGNGAGDQGIASGGGGDSITLGNGDGDYVVGDSTGARDTFTLGHGVGDIADLDTGLPTGYGDAGADTVTFGGPDATLELSLAGNSFATPPTGASASTAGLDVIHGLVAGDQIDLYNPTILALAMASNFAGVAGEAVFAVGTFNAGAQTFTVNASGHDAMLTYSDLGGYASVVLVGAAHEIAGSSIHADVITLG